MALTDALSLSASNSSLPGSSFPFSILAEGRLVHYTIGSRDLAVFFKPGTLSAFVDLLVGGPAEIGATGVFDPILDGQKLTFRAEGETFVDSETGSVWNILVEAIEGLLSGRKLQPINHAKYFWFAWGAFKPDTKIFQGAG